MLMVVTAAHSIRCYAFHASLQSSQRSPLWHRRPFEMSVPPATELPKAERYLTPGSILLAGATAGLAVDLTLYPIDTIKTRLQAKEGFRASGGFKRIYAGTSSILVGSAPGAAAFFCAYEGSKKTLEYVPGLRNHASSRHVVSASIGEVVACLVRVPTEIVKQRSQARPEQSVREIFAFIRNKEGFLGFYRGFGSTVLRDAPFSVLQFPMWEWLKVKWSQRLKEGQALEPWESALCGSLAGGISAGLTTPLDVAKTRIMLNTQVGRREVSIRAALRSIYEQRGAKGLFAGFVPRVVAMTLGGFIFFGAYELALAVCYRLFGREVGLDRKLQMDVLDRIVRPQLKKGPQTWDEMVEFARKEGEREPGLRK